MGISTSSGTFYGSYVDVSKIEHLREKWDKDGSFDDFNLELAEILNKAGYQADKEEVNSTIPEKNKKIKGMKWISLVATCEFGQEDYDYFVGVKLDEKTAPDWKNVQQLAEKEMDIFFSKVAPLKKFGDYSVEGLTWVG